MTNDYHYRRRGTSDRDAGQTQSATTLIRSQCRARPDGISSVSRADASRFIAPGITTPHARHRVDTRQASARPTPGGASGHTPGDASGHAPGDASGQPTVVIISPPELGGVRGGLNRRRGSPPKTGGGDGGVSLTLVQTTPPYRAPLLTQEGKRLL